MIRTATLSKDIKKAGDQITQAVFGLTTDLQMQRELHLENLYRSLAVAQHTDCLWKRAKWK